MGGTGHDMAETDSARVHSEDRKERRLTEPENMVDEALCMSEEREEDW